MVGRTWQYITITVYYCIFRLSLLCILTTKWIKIVRIEAFTELLANLFSFEPRARVRGERLDFASSKFDLSRKWRTSPEGARGEHERARDRTCASSTPTRALPLTNNLSWNTICKICQLLTFWVGHSNELRYSIHLSGGRRWKFNHPNGLRCCHLSFDSSGQPEQAYSSSSA